MAMDESEICPGEIRYTFRDEPIVGKLLWEVQIELLKTNIGS
jgi:hypothetical protein